MDVDVLIIGGGLVGGTLAVALADAGLQVCVVDRDDPETLLAVEFDGRASAIAAGSKRILESIGVWKHLADQAGAINDIRVSEAGTRHFLHYDHREIGGDALGYMLENRTLREALFKEMTALENISWQAPTVISELMRTSEGVQATLANGQKTTARLAVACDGRMSKTRQKAGIKVTKWGYDQSGIVCTVRHEHSHEGVAHEHFLPVGPFAILPLKGSGKDLNRLSSIVWTEKPALVPSLMAMNEADFLDELEARFGDFLGKIKVVGPRWAYPLGLQFARQCTAQRLALAGDASHAMHPIAGQGVNMGFRDVAALVEVITTAVQNGEDIGSESVLENYARWRNFDNTLMLATTDGLNRLFSNRIGPIKLARNLGLSAVGQVPPLKKILMRHAMGLIGELPKLMQRHRN